MTAVKELNVTTLRKIVITEKAMRAQEKGAYVFKVNPDATKDEIKHIVESIYSVEVLKVNTLNMSGKEKTTRGRKGRRGDFKKAYVRLKPGFSIDTSENI